jgi:hypothetical protein
MSSLVRFAGKVRADDLLSLLRTFIGSRLVRTVRPENRLLLAQQGRNRARPAMQSGAAAKNLRMSMRKERPDSAALSFRQ